MREITVATVQMKPELGNPENNLVKMSDYISTIASQQKVDLIVFPELVTSGYELGVQFTELAQRVPGPAVNLMAQRAADVGVFIAFGMVTKERVESIIYNSALLVGPEGELVGQYHKVHLRGEERMAFREGFKLPVFDTGEIGRIGMMVGWDLAFPEVSRAMALDGAELLCVMANWETSYIEEWKTYVRARAFENAVFVAAANRVGEDVTMSFGGESMIVGPRGKLHAYLDSAEPEFRKQLELDLKKALEKGDDMRAKLEEKIEEVKDKLVEVKAKSDEKKEKDLKREAEEKAERAKDEKRDLEAKRDDKDAVKGDKDKPDVKDERKDDKDKAEAKKDDDKAKPDEKREIEAKREEAKVIAIQPMLPTSGEVKAEFKKLSASEGFCVARIDLDEVRRYREEFQTIQARQPTVYKMIVKRY
jgi:predicted amidohydrolase